MESQDEIGALERSGEIPPVHFFEKLKKIPNNFCNVVESTEVLKSSVFPNIRSYFKVHKWLCERAILALKNNSVNALNLQIQQELLGGTTSYKSVDTIAGMSTRRFKYSTEFLNSFELSGMPPHNLLLKIASPIMLLRNLDAPRLHNGTRLCVKSPMAHVIETTILTDCTKG